MRSVQSPLGLLSRADCTVGISSWQTSTADSHQWNSDYDEADVDDDDDGSRRM